jgi:hypothetical protein
MSKPGRLSPRPTLVAADLDLVAALGGDDARDAASARAERRTLVVDIDAVVAGPLGS